MKTFAIIRLFLMGLAIDPQKPSKVLDLYHGLAGSCAHQHLRKAPGHLEPSLKTMKREEPA